jgi:hypothetical protein
VPASPPPEELPELLPDELPELLPEELPELLPELLPEDEPDPPSPTQAVAAACSHFARSALLHDAQAICELPML